MKKTICLDFDGVIHKYSQGWQNGRIYDDPVEGAFKAMKEFMDQDYKVIICTTREDLSSIELWLRQQASAELFPSDIGLIEKERIRALDNFVNLLTVTNKKPLASWYIDDRAVRFTNWTDIRKYFI